MSEHDLDGAVTSGNIAHLALALALALAEA